MTQQVRVAISIGCPSGIGPEVSLLGALRARERGIACALVGDAGAIRSAMALHGVQSSLVMEVGSPADCFANAGQLAVFNPAAPLHAEERTQGNPSQAGGARAARVDQ